jgi:hypothetical protein
MQTKAQWFARERNWNRAQIIGACGNMQRLAHHFGRVGIAEQLKSIEQVLLRSADDYWQHQKENHQL